MCAKLPKMSAGMGAGIGFGLDTLGHLGSYAEEQRLTADINRDRALQNQLKMNAYNTKNRNAENAWRNKKLDSDAAVDSKWRETKDAIAEAQLKARYTAGQEAIAQQQILTKMINAGAGREQTGRRSGRASIGELGSQYAA